MNLGEKIYYLRKEKNLSQSTLAEMCDVSRQSVSKWETENSVPELDKLMKLCEIFEVSLDELTQREDTKPPAPITTTLSHAQITGYILLAATLFGGIFTVVQNNSLYLWLLIMPMAVLTAVCLKVKQHTAYRSAWVILNALGVYMVTGYDIIYTMCLLVPGYIAMYFYTKKEFADEIPVIKMPAKTRIASAVAAVGVSSAWYIFRHSDLYMQILAEGITSIYSIQMIIHRFAFPVTCILYFTCLNVISYVFYAAVVCAEKKTEQK